MNCFLQLAADQRNRNNKWNNQRRGSDNQPIATSLNAFDEDRGSAMNDQGRIIRVDMFKGFTAEQQRRMLQDNEDIIRAKNAAKERDRRQEYDWMVQQDMSLRAMELVREQ